jgi:hypothetical protein
MCAGGVSSEALGCLPGLGTPRGIPELSVFRGEKPTADRCNAPIPRTGHALERLENGESRAAAALIRQQAKEIDDLWDRLSRAYALVREESPAELIQDEMNQLQAMLEGRRKQHPGTIG